MLPTSRPDLGAARRGVGLTLGLVLLEAASVRGNNGGNNRAVAGWHSPAHDSSKCLKQQRPALVVAGRRRPPEPKVVGSNPAWRIKLQRGNDGRINAADGPVIQARLYLTRSLSSPVLPKRPEGN